MSKTREYIKPDILVVEDDPLDRTLIKQAFEKAGNLVKLHFCENGMMALQFLNHIEQYIDSPKPKACLVDINMPGISGIELLALMKRDNHLKQIPVTIFSSSEEHSDINRCYESQACGYVKKPNDRSEMNQIAVTLSKYWTETLTLPTN